MTKQKRRTFVATVGTLGLAGCSSLAEQVSFRKGRNTRQQSSAPTTVADDFEDLSRWQTIEEQGSVSKSTDAYQGSQCARVTGSQQSKEGHLAKSLSGTDVRATNFSIAVRATTHEFFKIAIELHAPDGDHVVQLKRTLLGPKERWVRVNFGVTNVPDGADLSKVTELRIVGRPVDPNANEPVDFLVDDLRTVSRPETGSVMLTFDDSHASHYRAYELMNEYSFAGVEGVIPKSVGRDDRLTEDQLATMADDGWDIAAHPNVQAYYFSEYSTEEQEELMKKTREYLRDHGFEDGARHLLVPKNAVGTETFDLAREYYDTIFNFGGCPNGMPLAGEDTIVSRINGKEVAETKKYIDYAADYGQLVVPLFHGVGEDGDVSESEFEAVLKYIEERNLNVVTASDLLESQ